MRARTPLLVSALTILAGSGAVFAEDVSVWSSTTVEYSTGMAEPVVRHESATWANGQQVQGESTVQGVPLQAAEAPLQQEVQQMRAAEQHPAMAPETYQEQSQQLQAYEERYDSYEAGYAQQAQPSTQQYQAPGPLEFDFDGFFRQTFSMFGPDMNTWPQSWVWDPVFHPVAQAPQRSIYLNGLQETPPVQTQGYGIARIWFQDGEMRYEIEAHNLSSPLTGAHFHRGEPGVKGPVVQPIVFNGTRASGTWQLTGQDALDLLSGRIYINVHTQQYPDGEVRGQL